MTRLIYTNGATHVHYTRSCRLTQNGYVHRTMQAKQRGGGRWKGSRLEWKAEDSVNIVRGVEKASVGVLRVGTGSPSSLLRHFQGHQPFDWLVDSFMINRPLGRIGRGGRGGVDGRPWWVGRGVQPYLRTRHSRHDLKLSHSSSSVDQVAYLCFQCVAE